MSAAKRFLRAGVATAALAGASMAINAWADYPDRPIRIIVPFAAGSGTDVVARATGTALSARMGVPVTVENTVGSEGAVGAATVAKAAPDGYTLLATSNPFTLAPNMAKAPAYDPVKDFVAVARLAVIPLALVTSGKSSFKTFDDLIVHMRQNPGKSRYATAGKGTLSHLEVEVMNRHLQVQAQDQPYRSAKDALAAAASGKADFFLANLPMALAQLNRGSLRALAVSSGARIPQTGGAPTLAEAMRRPGYEVVVWFGLLAPAGTSSPVLQRLENEIERELEVPAVIARIESIGGRVAFQRSAPFGGQIRFEHAKWGQAAKALQ
jgi:tripartite-type tricarboxylate transporter receptor subunit TctC